MMEFLKRPSITETLVDILLCAVPIWLAVMIDHEHFELSANVAQKLHHKRLYLTLGHGMGLAPSFTLLIFKIEYEILFYEIIRLKAKSRQGEPTSAAILQ